jgi:regulator of protease activity HflC (stomatin/prohibitin superfamily)
MKKFLALMIMTLSLCSCGEQIDTGNRGLKTMWGEITSEKPLEEGLYFYMPFGGNVIEYEGKTQKYTMEIETYTKDIQTANMKITLNYRLDLDNIINLHREIGRNYEEKVLRPNAEAVVKDVIGKWDAANLVANREKATDEIKRDLNTTLTAFYIKIGSVSLNNIEYTDAFERAIEAKVVATQKAEEARNRTAEVQEEAKQKVLAAEAEAKSMAIRSEALSKNQNLVMYEAVQKWDGKLPVNIYGSAPIPFINSIK